MTALTQHKLEIAEAFGRAAMNYDRMPSFSAMWWRGYLTTCRTIYRALRL